MPTAAFSKNKKRRFEPQPILLSAGRSWPPYVLMSYLNYDKFALNSDDEGSAGDELMGEDSDANPDEGPLVEPDEWKKEGDDYPELGEEENE